MQWWIMGSSATMFSRQRLVAGQAFSKSPLMRGRDLLSTSRPAAASSKLLVLPQRPEFSPLRTAASRTSGSAHPFSDVGILRSRSSLMPASDEKVRRHSLGWMDLICTTVTGSCMIISDSQSINKTNSNRQDCDFGRTSSPLFRTKISGKS